MILLWSFIIICVLALVTVFFVLRMHAQRIERQAYAIEEALWQRRNRVPLLLELAREQIGQNRQTIIELRADLQTSIETLEEKIAKEKEFTTIIHHMLEVLKGDEKHHVLLNAIRHEFKEIHTEIERAINDYNFYVERWAALMRWPWFKFFAFSFSQIQTKPIPYV